MGEKFEKQQEDFCPTHWECATTHRGDVRPSVLFATIDLEEVGLAGTMPEDDMLVAVCNMLRSVLLVSNIHSDSTFVRLAMPNVFIILLTL
mmetsp:Transcript_17379/g.40344  ORF Transcript_17379/g.40344 Transcript_17379/m.40344 type:complete len:91 (+) Transcript_17379:87-359(+)